MRLTQKTRIALEFLLETGVGALDLLTRPTKGLFGCGAWEDEDLLDRQLERMEAKGWIRRERDRDDSGWIPHLTKLGAQTLTDSIDPEASWNAPWGGKWSVISFDLPASRRDQRHQLDDWLARRRFGHLQGSLWISHRHHRDCHEEFSRRKIDPHAVILFHGSLVTTADPRVTAAEAWDFKEINRRYRAFIDYLSQNPTPWETGASRAQLPDWFAEQSKLWSDAFAIDPFLPNALLPSGYLGKTALAKRREAFSRLGKHLQEATASPSAAS